MICYIVFTEAGAEVKRGTCQEELLDWQKDSPEHIALEVQGLEPGVSYYLENGDIKEAKPLALEIARNYIGGIPEGASAYYAGFAGDIITDGEIEFVSDISERIAVTISHFKFIEQTVEIEVGP